VWIGLAAWRRKTGTVLVRTAAVHILVYALLLAWVLPAANSIKSTRVQGAWIADRVGAETHMGLVYNDHDYGFRKMGSFGLYAGKRVELLESRSQVNRFFEVYPGSIVLIQVDEAHWIFGEDAVAWEARIERELWIGNDHDGDVRGNGEVERRGVP